MKLRKDRTIQYWSKWRLAVQKERGFIRIDGDKDIACALFDLNSDVLCAEYDGEKGTIEYKWNCPEFYVECSVDQYPPGFTSGVTGKVWRHIDKRFHEEMLSWTPEEFCRIHDACMKGRVFAYQYKTMKEVWDACTFPWWHRWMICKLSMNLEAYSFNFEKISHIIIKSRNFDEASHEIHNTILNPFK